MPSRPWDRCWAPRRPSSRPPPRPRASSSADPGGGRGAGVPVGAPTASPLRRRRDGRRHRRLARAVPLGRRRVPDRGPAPAARRAGGPGDPGRRPTPSARSTTGPSSARPSRRRSPPSPSRSSPPGRPARGPSRGGRRSAAPPTPCASRVPAPRRWPRPWTGCWPCSTSWASRRMAGPVAAELAAEAGRIIAEATDDHGALVGHVLALPARRARTSRSTCSSPGARARWAAASSGPRCPPSRRSTTRAGPSGCWCRRDAPASRGPASRPGSCARRASRTPS